MSSASANNFFQNSYYIGNNFNCILYGVELVLYFRTMHLLGRLGHRRTRTDTFFMAFSTALLFLITIYVIVQSFFGEEMWIVNANFPGGSAAYLGEFAAIWYETLGTTASIALNLLADGLLIHRCHTIWNDWRVIVLPIMIYLSALAVGIVELDVSGNPNGNFFAGFAVRVGLAYYSLSIGLNVLCTFLILGRILHTARTSRKYLSADIAQTYFSIAALIVESALPYSLSGVAFLVSYGMNSPISILFLSIYVMFTCVSPQMLILRVVEGRGLKRGQLSTNGRTGNSATVRFTSAGPVNVTQFTETAVGDESYHLQLKEVKGTGSSGMLHSPV